jgi:hypothetical protein
MARKACWLLLCVFGLVCSCHKEEDVPVAATEAIAPRFVGQKGISWKSDTRAADTEWTSSDVIGIYMLKKNGTTYDYTLSEALDKNRMYMAGDTTKGEFVPAAGHAIYFPFDGSVRFVAYYPYQADADNASTANKVTFTFTGQSTLTDKESKDFAFHKGTEEYSKSNPNVALAFQHKFCKIKITIKKGGGCPSLNNLEVSLTNMPVSAMVDLAKLAKDEDDSIITQTTSTTILSYVDLDNENETQAVAEAIVPPHTGTGNFINRVFHFKVGSNSYTYSLPNDVTFASGQEYNYEFTLYNSTMSDGLTNCYIVKPGESVAFPVSRAYRYDGTNFTNQLHTGENYNGEFSVDVLWEDLSDLIKETTVTGSGNQAEVTVETNISAGGNAVVKIFKKGDTTETPVWSYHIWVTDPDAIRTWTNPNNTAYTFMDRNLGATEAEGPKFYGLFYQWGRKDPFREAGNATIVGPTNIIESIKGPITFIKNSTNWLPERKEDLWNDGGNKTIYDPCPAGWRVPFFIGTSFSEESSPWQGFENMSWSENGITFADNAQYPVPGYLAGSSGDLKGSVGYYWSASINSTTQGYALMITESSGISANGKLYLSNGCSVRCVREVPVP